MSLRKGTGSTAFDFYREERGILMALQLQTLVWVQQHVSNHKTVQMGRSLILSVLNQQKGRNLNTFCAL